MKVVVGLAMDSCWEGKKVGWVKDLRCEWQLIYNVGSEMLIFSCKLIPAGVLTSIYLMGALELNRLCWRKPEETSGGRKTGATISHAT